MGLSLGLDLTGIPAGQGAAVGPSNVVDPDFSGLTPSAFEVAGDGLEEIDLDVHAADENDVDLSGKATTIAQAIVRADVGECGVLAAGQVEADTPTVVTITINDENGQPIPDVDPTEVVVAATGTGNTIIQPTERTNVIGETYATFESSVEEVKTLSATIEGAAITATTQITVGDPPSPPGPGDPDFTDDFAGPARNSDEVWTWSAADADVTPVTAEGRDCLRFRFGPDAPGQDSNAEQRFVINENITEIWMQYDAFYPSNYVQRNESPSNNKFFRIWGDDYDSVNKMGAQTWYSGSSTKGAIRIDRALPGGDGSIGPGTGGGLYEGSPTIVAPFPLDEWCQIRIHSKMTTSTLANDAEVTVWVNGVEWISWDNLNQLYDSGTPYWNAGYLFGAANTGFLEETDILVSDFSAYWTNDPGW